MIGLTSTLDLMSSQERIDRYLSDIARGEGHTALEELYLCTKDAVYGYALSILKNTHDAEDVLHDCFVSVYQAASGYISSGKPMAWIFTIVRNLCLGRLRAKSRVSDVPEEDVLRTLEASGSASFEDRLLISHCLRELSEEERDIVLLHVLAGLKHREIASMTDRPLSTILSKYHRALGKLRAILKEEDRTNE